MLEKIYKKIINEKIIKKIEKNEKNKKLFVASIFFLNLSIYSIPLLLFHLEIIKIPSSIINLFSEFIYKFDILKIEKELHENIIRVKDSFFYIDQQCLGIKSILGLFAIILSVPTRNYKKKIIYFLLFSIILFLINILRIYSTIYLYYFFNINPFLLHDILWNFLNFVFIFSIWIFFFKRNKKDIILFS